MEMFVLYILKLRTSNENTVSPSVYPGFRHINFWSLIYTAKLFVTTFSREIYILILILKNKFAKQNLILQVSLTYNYRIRFPNDILILILIKI